MKQILIFAGTTEGRQLIERLCQYHIQIHACVATEYGKEVLPHSKQITIHAAYGFCTNGRFLICTCIRLRR